jgi:hypothetical protein
LFDFKYRVMTRFAGIVAHPDKENS